MPSHSQQVRTWVNRLIPLIFYALLIGFLWLYVRSIDLTKLRHLHFNAWYLLLACALALLARYGAAFTWWAILRSLGAQNVAFDRPLVAVYAKAWLGRYIPGTAPWILGKIYFASRQGISKQKLAVSSVLEGGLQIVTMLVFALALLAFDSRLDVIGSGFKLVMVLVAIAGLIAVIPSVFNYLIGLAFRLLRRGPLPREHAASRRTIAIGASMYLFDALVNGLGLFFIAKAVDPSLSYHSLAFVMGAASLAGAASMLALFAPSGLGVREGIQLVLFSLIMPRELALAVTIVTRLWSVGIDLVFYAMTRTRQPSS